MYARFVSLQELKHSHRVCMQQQGGDMKLFHLLKKLWRAVVGYYEPSRPHVYSEAGQIQYFFVLRDQLTPRVLATLKTAHVGYPCAYSIDGVLLIRFGHLDVVTVSQPFRRELFQLKLISKMEGMVPMLNGWSHQWAARFLDNEERFAELSRLGPLRSHRDGAIVCDIRQELRELNDLRLLQLLVLVFERCGDGLPSDLNLRMRTTRQPVEAASA